MCPASKRLVVPGCVDTLGVAHSLSGEEMGEGEGQGLLGLVLPRTESSSGHGPTSRSIG